MKHPIRRRVMFLAFQGLRAVAQALPEGAADRLGGWIGAVAYACASSQRRLTHQHLEQALGLPLAERRRVARQVFDNLGRNFIEWLRLPRLSLSALQQRVQCDGLDHLRQALAHGRGAIAITPHFGNWELISPYLRSLGFEGAVLARRLRYPEYESFLVSMRQEKGIATLLRGSLKEVAQVLRKNHIVGLLPDQDVDSLEGVFVPFFGRPAHTPAGPAALSLMTRAPIVPCFLLREGRGFRLVIEPAVAAPAATDRGEAVRELTAAWSAVLESFIRRHPGHWTWMHRRWKTQPLPSPARDQRESRGASAPRDGAQPAFALLAALLLSLAAGAGCGGGNKLKAAAGAHGPDQAMDRFTLSSFRADDTRKWELEGQGATVDGKFISVTRPVAVGYDQARTAHLTAGVAQVNQDTRAVRLEYEATIHTSDGLWFTSPILYWLPDTQQYHTDEAVRIETDRLLLRGRGSEGFTALKRATLYRDIELVLNPGDAPVSLTGGVPAGISPVRGQRHATITCDGPLDFDYERDIATFHTNVRVQDANGDLYSDTLVAYLDPQTRMIRYAEATGRVRIHQQRNIATSEKAVYQPALGKITLVGRPSLLVYPSGGASAPLIPADGHGAGRSR